MDWHGWLTLGLVALAFGVMVRGIQTPDVALMATALVLAAVGVITPGDLLAGFSNEGMLTIAALVVVAAGLRETGALDGLGRLMLRRAKSQRTILARLCPQVAALSSFLNNTAVVAMLLPIVNDWCRHNRVSPSRVLLPLSYAAVLGGTCTLIGTSTNLIVSGLMAGAASQHAADSALRAAFRPIGFFEVTVVGVAAVIVGVAYIVLVAHRWLPDRAELLEDFGTSAREYLVNMVVREGSPLVGQRVKDAGLRRLPGLFLIEITRQRRVIAPVTPTIRLQAGDRLTFTGLRSTIVDLERMPGLERVEHHPEEVAVAEPEERFYTEAVVSSTSPLIGRNIRDSNFRALYNAVVVAVHRGGTHLSGRVGDIVLEAGDTLLLQTGPNFVKAHANNPDFYLVGDVADARPIRREKAGISMALLVLLVIAMCTGLVPVVIAALLAAGGVVLTRCISGGEALRSMPWNVLLTIAAAMAVGHAMNKSGVAPTIAGGLVDLTRGLGPVGALAAIYLVAMLATELLTNGAAAALVFPLALSMAGELGVNPRPFVMAVVFGASFGFATPIGYQTNLMVLGPGGYHFRDFLRVGLPLNVLLWILAVALIPMVWALEPVN